MDPHSLLAFTFLAAVAIASPGPATIMAINNSLAFGPRYAVWSSLGNACGLFCLSAAAVSGLGALLASSEWMFNAVKLLGAGYLLYLGVKQLLNKRPILVQEVQPDGKAITPSRMKLYKSAFLTAVTNPKATIFFTALFPQFVNPNSALLPQHARPGSLLVRTVSSYVAAVSQKDWVRRCRQAASRRSLPVRHAYCTGQIRSKQLGRPNLMTGQLQCKRMAKWSVILQLSSQ